MKRYHGIQLLRFVAASLVIIEHFMGDINRHFAEYAQFTVPSLGEVGVIVFFGISGFIMVATQSRNFGTNDVAIDFFIRRVIRVLPIYAIATTLQYINKINFSEAYTFTNYIKSLLCIPYIGAGGLYRPVLAQGWTLNIEMFFYAVFAVSLIFKRATGLILTIALLFFIAMSQDLVRDAGVLAFYAKQIIVFFICGMIAALVIERWQPSTQSLLLPTAGCAAAIVTALFLRFYIDEALRYCINLLIVFGCIIAAASYQGSNQARSFRFFETLGEASYSTYLFHGFVLGAGKFITSHISPTDYWKVALGSVFFVAAGNLAGVIGYRFLEQPIARFFRTHYPSNKTVMVKS